MVFSEFYDARAKRILIRTYVPAANRLPTSRTVAKMEGGGGAPEQSPRTVAKATRSERAAPEGQSESEPEPAQEPEPNS